MQKSLLVLAATSLLVACSWITTAAAAAPKAGDKAEDFELKSFAGSEVKLSTIAKENKNVVLIALRGYPGYQCPLCNRQVASFIDQAEKFKSAGSTVVFVYPGPSDGLTRHAEEFIKGKSIPDGFHLLLDPDYKFVDSYKIRWNEVNETAYPATFVIDGDLKITYAKVSEGHDGRTTPKEVLAAIKKTK